MDLNGKAAVVTGGSKGIGRAIATALAGAGANVVVCSRTQTEVNSAANEISSKGPGRCVGVVIDVRDMDQVRQVMRKAEIEFGGLDILVNNAGIGNFAHVSKMAPHLWNDVIDTNLTGVFYCMRAIIKPMMEQRSGRIINIGSLAAVNGGYFSTPSYTAAKAGIMGLTMLAARWLGKYGINVNVVNPGPIPTEGAIFGTTQLEALGRTIPFRRGGVETEMLGKPEDIASAVLYFASDLSSYVSGTRINVLGGQHMG